MTQSTRYAYLIGANGPEINGQRLRHAERDTVRLATALKGPHCRFADATTTVAHTRHDVLNSLNNYIQQCKENDVLLIHFSGHAIFDKHLYLICNETKINNLISSAIKIDDVKEYLEECKARYKVLILDCCQSGGAIHGIYKGGQDVRDTLQKVMHGSGSVIIAACSQREKARELDELDGGSGFLSWAIYTACTTDFDQATSDQHLLPLDQRSLSINHAWKWIIHSLQKLNSTLCKEDSLPDPVFQNLMVGEYSEVWLTDPPTVDNNITLPNHAIREKYLKSVIEHYHTVALPVGHAEGFLLQTIFQPLKLQSEPLATEELARQQRRASLREELEANTKLHPKQATPNQKHPDSSALHVNDAIEALKRSPQQRIVVLGGPGTGKTTTLKYLITLQAEKAIYDPEAHIPIFLSLAPFAQSKKAFQDYLITIVEDMDIDRAYAAILRREIENGHAFICLDGLDEVDPKQRGQLIKLINSKASQTGNYWIVGSRYTEYKGGQFKRSLFTEWKLLPMSSSTRKKLAEQLFLVLQNSFSPTSSTFLSPTNFVSYLEKHQQTSAWAENPLLFSLAAIIYVQKGDLPTSRAILYGEIVEAVLEIKEQDSIRRSLIRRFLGRLALWTHSARGRTFSLDDLVDFFLEDFQVRSFNDIEQTIKSVIHSGIIEPVAKNTYAFQHQTFQEYLAALELARRLTSQDEVTHQDAWTFVWNKRTYSRWIEVLRLMVGILAQLPGTRGSSFLQSWLSKLLEQRTTTDGDPGNLGLALTLLSLREISEIAQWSREKIIYVEEKAFSIWLEELRDAAASHRSTMLIRLRALGREVDWTSKHIEAIALRWLESSLNSYESSVKHVVADVMRKLGQRVPFSLLLSSLQDRHWYVREVAIDLLKAQAENVPFELLQLAAMDTHLHVRLTASKMLVLQADQIPLASLLKNLYSTNLDIHLVAMKVLKARKSLPIEPFLSALYDQDENVRDAAETILSTQKNIPIEPFLSALRNQDIYIRKTAIKILGAQGVRCPLKPLSEALFDESIEVRETALFELEKQGERVPLKHFLQALHDESWIIRKEAVEIVGKRAADTLSETLTTMLNDPSEDVRYTVVKELGKQEKNLPIIIRALYDENEQVCRAAVEVLEANVEHIPLEALIAALKDKKKHVRQASMKLLGARKEEALYQALLAALQDDDENVRCEAVKELVKYGELVPIESFLCALDDQSIKVRRSAIDALASRSNHISSELLLELLDNDEHYIMQSAMEMLEKHTQHIPLKPLLAALQSQTREVRSKLLKSLLIQREPFPFEQFNVMLHQETNSDIRLSVCEVLRTQGVHIPQDVLLPYVQDKDEHVRQWAIEILKLQGEWETKEFLQTLKTQGHWYLKQAAIEVAGVQRELVPCEFLLAALSDPVKDVREAAITALSLRDEDIPSGPLLTALQKEHGYMREAILKEICRRKITIPWECLKSMLYDNSNRVQQVATEVLHQQKEQIPLDTLLAILQDSNPHVRQAGIKALKGQRQRIPFERIFALLQDKDTNVRSTTIQILGTFGEHVPIDIFLSALRDKELSIRQAALNVLKKQKKRIPQDWLESTLQNHKKSKKAIVIELLGILHEEALLNPLLEALYDEKLWITAIDALIAQGERVPLETLLTALQSEETHTRYAALKVLEARKNVPIEPLLTALAYKDVDTRYGALLAISSQEISRPTHILLQALSNACHDDEKLIRQAAIKALGSIGNKTPLELILEALHDKEADVQCEALIALGKRGKLASLELVLEALHDQDADVRKEAVKILGMQGENIPFESLVTSLQDLDWRVGEAAIEVLSNQADHIPIDLLLQTLYHERSDVRLAILKILRIRKESAPLETLLEVLQDQNNDVRCLAAQIINKVFPEALHPITKEAIEILQGKPAGDFFRTQLQLLLINIIDDVGEPVPLLFEELIDLLQAPHWQVRRNAACVLGKLARNIPDNGIRYLLNLRYNDPINAVRNAADDALAEILSLETGIEDD